MRVFVTGATGFIGSALVRDLIDAGHQVLGLARSDASAKALEAAGAEVHRGDLEDLDSLRRGAESADGVLHTGFIHDFSRFKAVCEIDRTAIEALGEVLAGSDRPLTITSGIAIVSPGRVATEEMRVAVGPNTHPRVASEEAADALVAKGVHISVVRLAPSVHGDGDHGFVPMLIDIARKKGVSAYIGEGLNRWTAVHKLDAARLFRLTLDNKTPGARFHGTAEEGVVFKEIAAVIGRQLNLPVVSLSKEEAAEHFGWFSHFAAVDCPASSKQTQERLGWSQVNLALLADMEQGRYFKA